MASSKVLKLTEKVFSRTTDLALFSIFYGMELAFGGIPSMKGVTKAGENALDITSEVNYQSIKRAISELRRQGLVRTFKNSLMEAEITVSGKKRIKSLMPQYQKKRPWDSNIYLVTYDVPVTQNWERDMLRMFLKKIGCGLLQESIWVTPYNPTWIVREFIENRGLEGTVLVSILGKEGSIGGMSLEELIEQVYNLTDLNGRYKEFLQKCRVGIPKAQLAFHYLSILNDDPQLPFELLPDDWVGDEAYQVFERMTGGK